MQKIQNFKGQPRMIFQFGVCILSYGQIDQGESENREFENSFFENLKITIL